MDKRQRPVENMERLMIGVNMSDIFDRKSSAMGNNVYQGILHATCEVCSETASLFLPYKGINKDNELESSCFLKKAIYQCSKCTHQFCYPRVEEQLLEKYYQTEFYKLRYWTPSRLKSIRSDIKASMAKEGDKQSQTQIDCLAQFIDEGRLKQWPSSINTLEIGAGAAGFSQCLSKQRTKLKKIDKIHVSEPSDHYKLRYFLSGIKNVASNFESGNFVDYYHVIAASQVLEHFIDINKAVCKIRKILGTNGLVFIEVPNCEDIYWEFRFFPNPPHLHFFTTKSLKRLFEKNGFEILFLQTCGRPLIFEKSVGYLHPETPELVSFDEYKSLETTRTQKWMEFVRVNPEFGMIDDLLNKYSDSGREFIRMVATISK